MTGNRIFFAFTIVFAAVLLFLLPLSEGSYDFRTDLRYDSFTVATAVGTTNATIQLSTEIYDDDTSTLDIDSNDVDDTPLFYSYNGTTRALLVIGLADNTTRTLGVTYDIDALEAWGAIMTLADRIEWVWLIIIIGFAPAALVALFTHRRNQ